MGGKLSGFKLVDLVRPCNLDETEVGVKEGYQETLNCSKHGLEMEAKCYYHV